METTTEELLNKVNKYMGEIFPLDCDFIDKCHKTSIRYKPLTIITNNNELPDYYYICAIIRDFNKHMFDKIKTIKIMGFKPYLKQIDVSTYSFSFEIFVCNEVLHEITL